MRDYGAVLIADPGLSEEGLAQLKSQFTELVTRHGGRVQEVSAMGRRRLSYRIGRHSEGQLLQIRMQLPPAGVDGLSKMARTLERVMRLMVLSGDSLPEPPAAKVDEKSDKGAASG